jgi:hypothetical protein
MTFSPSGLAEAPALSDIADPPRARRSRNGHAPLDAVAAAPPAPRGQAAGVPAPLVALQRAGERVVESWQALASRQMALAGEALDACTEGWCRVLSEPSPERRLELRTELALDGARRAAEAGAELADLALAPTRELAEAGAAAWVAGLEALAEHSRG